MLYSRVVKISKNSISTSTTSSADGDVSDVDDVVVQFGAGRLSKNNIAITTRWRRGCNVYLNYVQRRQRRRQRKHVGSRRLRGCNVDLPRNSEKILTTLHRTDSLVVLVKKIVLSQTIHMPRKVDGHHDDEAADNVFLSTNLTISGSSFYEWEEGYMKW